MSPRETLLVSAAALAFLATAATLAEPVTSAAPPAAVAVTVERFSPGGGGGSASSSSAAAASQPTVDVVHLTCFTDSAAGDGDAAAGRDGKESCCAALRTTVRELCSPPPPSSSADGGGAAASSAAAPLSPGHRFCRRDGWQEGTTCASSVAAVPSAAAGIDGCGWVRRPAHYLSVPDRHLGGRAAASEGGADGYRSRGGGQRTYAQYVRDFSEPSGEGVTEASVGSWPGGAASPFRLASGAAGHLVPTSEGGSVMGWVSSSVSDSGGMHRRHDHRIRLSFVDNLPSLQFSPASISGNMTVLLPISEGIFVDVDDPFQDGGDCTVRMPGSGASAAGGECRAELADLAPGEVVDIEQPSFASSQHVLAVRVSFAAPLSWQGDSTEMGHSPRTVPDIEVEFASTLHLRYQPPIVEETLGRLEEGGYAFVHVPTAFIAGGNVAINGRDVVLNDIPILPPSEPQKFEETEGMVELLVATGRDADYGFVVSVTLFASIVGFIAMIRDISKVSIWR